MSPLLVVGGVACKPVFCCGSPVPCGRDSGLVWWCWTRLTDPANIHSSLFSSRVPAVPVWEAASCGVHCCLCSCKIWSWLVKGELMLCPQVPPGIKTVPLPLKSCFAHVRLSPPTSIRRLCRAAGGAQPVPPWIPWPSIPYGASLAEHPLPGIPYQASLAEHPWRSIPYGASLAEHPLPSIPPHAGGAGMGSPQAAEGQGLSNDAGMQETRIGIAAKPSEPKADKSWRKKKKKEQQRKTNNKKKGMCQLSLTHKGKPRHLKKKSF